MTPEMFRKLSALGLTHEQMAGVLEVFEGQEKAEEERRAKGRERWHRWNDKRKTNVSKHELTLANNSRDRVARVGDNLQTKNIPEQEERKISSPSARSSRGARIPDDFKPDINAAIAEGLSRRDAERAALSFIDYWRAKPGSAALKLDWPATWRTWFRRRIDELPRSTAPPPSSKRDFNDVLDELQGKTRHDVQPGPTFDASNNRADFGGSAGVVQLHAISARR